MKQCMLRPFIMVACLSPVLATSLPVEAAARTASVALVWRVPAPQSADPGVQAVEAGLTAVLRLNPEVGAVAAHRGSRATFALDPQFIAALELLAGGNSALERLAQGRLTLADSAAGDLLDVLSSSAVIERQSSSAAARRFAAHAAAARLALMGNSAARFSSGDIVDFAGSGVLLALVSNGYAGAQATLLKKDSLDRSDLRLVADAFSNAARDLLARLKRMTANRSIELAVLPAYEPVVPLLIDAAGRTRQAPFTVSLAARADAGAAIDEGTHAVGALSGEAHPGIMSPQGAYDDETGALIQEHDSAYAIFSDRVAKAVTGASSEAVKASQAAGLHAYLLETSQNNKLPVLFCSDAASAALEVLPQSSPAAALGDRVRALALEAAGVAGPTGAAILLVCMDAASPALQRSDRVAVLAHVAAVLASGSGLQATTPLEFLRKHPATAQTYGFQPATKLGGFGLWMGTANQASLWTALSNARKSVGGDAALGRSGTRAALLRAESNRWFAAVSLPQPRAAVERTLSQFRSAIAEIYRAANMRAPNNIAPVKWDRPEAVGPPAAVGP